MRGEEFRSKTTEEHVAPECRLIYETPDCERQGIYYYKKDIILRMIISEKHFLEEQVEVIVNKNDQKRTAKTIWVISSGDMHEGLIPLTGDGVYTISVNAEDGCGNKMHTCISNKIVIDRRIDSPVVLVNGENPEHKSFVGDIDLQIVCSDLSLDTCDVRLYQRRYKEESDDVTQQFIEETEQTEQRYIGKGNHFEKIPENDGIYTLSVSFADILGHFSGATYEFTINRFGSRYECNQALDRVLKNNRMSVRTLKEDFVITEYNPDPVLEKSIQIRITRNGKRLEQINYQIASLDVDNEQTDHTAWHQYEYRISAENFIEEGIYKVQLSSQDQAGNVSDFSWKNKKQIFLRVDRTPPEIHLCFLNDQMAGKGNTFQNTIWIYDAVGIDHAKVYVNDELYKSVNGLSENMLQLEENLAIVKSRKIQKIRIVAEDDAGNTSNIEKNISVNPDFWNRCIAFWKRCSYRFFLFYRV